MRCYMLWHCNNGNFSAPYIEDREEFPSIKAMKAEFWSRARDRHYVYPGTETPENGGPEGHVFFSDPVEMYDPYPDALISFGPRGGVRLDPC